MSTVWLFVCPGAAPGAYSCFAHVRPCAQGRCGRCPLGFGMMSIFSYFFLPSEVAIVMANHFHVTFTSPFTSAGLEIEL